MDTLSGRLLDVVADRTTQAVASWLARRDRRWLGRIGVVTLDPHRGYAQAMGVHLGHATLVVDHFHAFALAKRPVHDVRRRVQQATLGGGRKHDSLYRVRRLLLKACDDSTPVAGGGWPKGCGWATPTTSCSRPGSSNRPCVTCTGLVTSTLPARRSSSSISGWPTQGSTSAADWPHDPPLGTRGSGRAHHRRHLERTDRGGQPGRSNASNASAGDSETSTTTDSGSCCTAASAGTLHPPHDSEPKPPAQLRKAAS